MKANNKVKKFFGGEWSKHAKKWLEKITNRGIRASNKKQVAKEILEQDKQG